MSEKYSARSPGTSLPVRPLQGHSWICPNLALEMRPNLNVAFQHAKDVVTHFMYCRGLLTEVSSSDQAVLQSEHGRVFCHVTLVRGIHQVFHPMRVLARVPHVARTQEQSQTKITCDQIRSLASRACCSPVCSNKTCGTTHVSGCLRFLCGD